MKRHVLLIALGLAAGVAHADIRDGLVGYYPLDEGSGETAYDASGNGNDGTLHNGASWIAQGAQNGAVNFDGTTDTRIELGTWNPAEGTGQLSLAMWIRWAGGGGTYQGLLGKRNEWPATTMFQFQVRPENGGTFRLETGTYAIVSPNGTLTPLVQTWAHVAATFDGTTGRLYLNGEEVASGSFAFTTAGEGSSMGIGCVTGGGAGHSGNGEVFSGDIDEVRIYNRALSEVDVQETMHGEIVCCGIDPDPRDEETDVLGDAVLSWQPSYHAETHDVYFGTIFEDVNAADRANSLDVLLSQDQADTSFDPPGRLTFGQTYYWRIDDVNGAPDFTIHRGRIWSFTAEPFSYPVETVQATASSQSSNTMGPENTVDGSGLNAADQHSVSAFDMWLSAQGDQAPWIQFEFENICKLHQMLVWNSNQPIEPFIGLGAKEVSIETSTDGEAWTPLKDAVLKQAIGLDSYSANTTLELGGVLAKYVRINVNGGYGPMGQYGLSEVRFFSVPIYASDPEPVDREMTESIRVVLQWRPGREATQHEVILSTDKDTVVNGSAVIGTSTKASFHLDGQEIQYGNTYYWAINEINDTDASAYLSPVWSFTAPEFTVIDDFDQYNDLCDRIFFAWRDGLGYSGYSSNTGSAECHELPPYEGNSTGSIVGYAQAPFTEKTITHLSSRQSMPFEYDNSLSPFYSEAEKLVPGIDLTAGDADILSLYFHGRPADFQENDNGTISMSGAGTDIWDFEDEFRFAYKQLQGDGSMAVKVESLLSTHAWAKAGVMIREASHSDARNACTVVTPSSGVVFQRRLVAADGTSLTGAPGMTAPYWVKITRSGNTLTGERSADGVTWEPMTADPADSSAHITMGSNVLIGLAVTSHMSDALTQAEFSQVSTTGNVTGPWLVEDVGVDQPTNSAEPLYLVLNNQVVAHPDPTATQAADWTEWEIPLSPFDSSNLENVTKIYLGVGDRDNPQAGGAGLLYFDDMRVGRKFKSTGLVAYYALENSTEDSSGNGNDGVAVGNPVYVEGPAGLGMALEFNGAGGQYVDLGTLNPARTGQFSLALWARWNGLSGFWQGLMGKRNTWAANDMMWDLEINIDNGSLYVHRHSFETVTMNPLVEGRWTHIAATYDGGTVRLYRDGVLVSSGRFTMGPKTDAALVFGAVEANGGNPFNGALDEVRIYDTVLTAEEVLELAGQ